MSTARIFLSGLIVASMTMASDVSAQEDQASIMPGLLSAGGALDNPDPDLVLTIGAGASVAPAYFGSEDLEFGPTGLFRFDFVRFPNGFTFGSGRSVGFNEGFGLRGAARFIGERKAEDYRELRGLDDIDWTMELGMGIGYEQAQYRFFADARYGFFGHEAFVGQIGADIIARPVDGLTVTFGPRLDLGDDKFMNTYFGVTPANAAASRYDSYSADGGIVSAGLELTALYQFDERWGVQGSLEWNRLLDDAANSPITQFGDDDQYQLRIQLVRRVSIKF